MTTYDNDIDTEAIFELEEVEVLSAPMFIPAVFGECFTVEQQIAFLEERITTEQATVRKVTDHWLRAALRVRELESNLSSTSTERP